MENIFNSNEPRGIRNNNPLNLIHVPRNHWKGLAGHDGRFCVFSDPQFGLRAAYKTMLSYKKRFSNELTIRSMIYRWCPDSTKDDYVNYVCRQSNLLPWDLVPFNDHIKMVKLLRYMIIMENGVCPYSNGFILQSINLK